MKEIWLGFLHCLHWPINQYISSTDQYIQQAKSVDGSKSPSLFRKMVILIGITFRSIIEWWIYSRKQERAVC